MARRTVGFLAALTAAALLAITAPLAVAQDGGGSDEPTTVRVALNGYENNLTPFHDHVRHRQAR